MIRYMCLVTVALAGLAGPVHAGPDRNLGASVLANIVTQAVDMDPDYRGRPLVGTSGRRAADAMIRYQTGKLKPLLRTNGKSDLGGQGGAGDEPTVSIPLISTGPK